MKSVAKLSSSKSIKVFFSFVLRNTIALTSAVACAMTLLFFLYIQADCFNSAQPRCEADPTYVFAHRLAITLVFILGLYIYIKFVEAEPAKGLPAFVGHSLVWLGISIVAGSPNSLVGIWAHRFVYLDTGLASALREVPGTLLIGLALSLYISLYISIISYFIWFFFQRNRKVLH